MCDVVCLISSSCIHKVTSCGNSVLHFPRFLCIFCFACCLAFIGPHSFFLFLIRFVSAPTSGRGEGASASRFAGRSRDARMCLLFLPSDSIYEYGAYLDLPRLWICGWVVIVRPCGTSDSGAMAVLQWKPGRRYSCTGVAIVPLFDAVFFLVATLCSLATWRKPSIQRRFGRTFSQHKSWWNSRFCHEKGKVQEWFSDILEWNASPLTWHIGGWHSPKLFSFGVHLMAWSVWSLFHFHLHSNVSRWSNFGGSDLFFCSGCRTSNGECLH